ncbi:MAG: efflux RND transporter periplasmic adaptor subunit [Planctomycetota bacterium]|nr:efflux RND transporter periplasmic adaptor subunit [Planctomycetota bacterium]
MKLRKTIVWSVVGAVAVAAVVVLVWFNPFASDPAPPKLVTVTRGELVEAASLSGKVEANAQVEVKSRASGEVIEIAVKVGDLVTAGDLLIKLDPADETRAVSQAEAALQSAQARLSRAQAALNIAQLQAAEAKAKYDARLKDAGDVITKEELRVARSNWEIAEGNVKSLQSDVQSSEAELRSAQLNLDQANLRLSETTIVAPIAATVLKIDVEKGTIIASGISNIGGGTALLTLGDLSALTVVGALDEADVGRVDEGQQVQIRVDAWPRRVFSGVVDTLSPLGVETSNIVTFDLDVRVTDKDFYLLRPGMNADLEVITGRHAGVLLVPVSAIYSEGEQYYVLTAEGERRDVKLGATDGTRYVVTEGVEEGQQLRVGTANSNLAAGPGMFGRR